jgi:hypothetical protein
MAANIQDLQMPLQFPVMQVQEEEPMDLDALANQFVVEDEQQMDVDEQLNVMAEEGQQVAVGE